VLFADAGLGEFVPLGQITEAHFDKTFGVFAATKAALRSFARTWSVDLKDLWSAEITVNEKIAAILLWPTDVLPAQSA
jgi:hypothetical protein